MNAFVNLNKNEYKGHLLNVRYTTEGAYDVIVGENGFRLERTMFPKPVEKTFEDALFADWLEHPIAVGCFANDELVGAIEGSIDSWHHLFRISNLWVDERFRRQGLASELMRRLEERAIAEHGPRGFVLETQSCNLPAIALYRKMGYSFIGLDTMAYTNDDVKRQEVRLELGKRIESRR